MTIILLVEDATDLAQVIVRELEAVGYEVVHAVDGVAALEMHARHSLAWSSSTGCYPGWTGWRCCDRSGKIPLSRC
jgi:CheY-like chemotaxis protein